MMHSQRERRQPLPLQATTRLPAQACASCSPICPPTTRTTRPTCRPLTTRSGAARNWRRSCPSDPSKPYDVRQVIGSIVDDGRFFEVHQLWAENMVVGFARLNGYVIGIVANQPMVLAGCIDIKASVKATHFIRLCDAYNIPSSRCKTCPASCPAPTRSYGGIIRNGARMIYAYSEATVPKLMIILRKSYGGAYCVMSQGAARRPALRLAQRRDRRDGRRGRGQHPLPQAGAGGRRPGRQAQGAGGRLRGEVQQPLCRCHAG
jgi:acetyl-CoA carboxylase carboxyltransferase component